MKKIFLLFPLSLLLLSACSEVKKTEIPLGVTGCNLSKDGECHDLEVDSKDGEITKIYYPNGQSIGTITSSCEENNCSATDDNGEIWKFNW